jgi:hypothetical protein
MSVAQFHHTVLTSKTMVSVRAPHVSHAAVCTAAVLNIGFFTIPAGFTNMYCCTGCLPH